MSGETENRGNVNTEGKGQARSALFLVFLSVLGVGVGYAASIVAARVLGPTAFENYAVAIASLSLLAAIAEAGVGKQALRVLPVCSTAQDWSLASGYCRFSLRVSLLVSVPLATVVLVSERITGNDWWDNPLGIAALFLPVTALAGIGVDFVMANRAAVAGTLIARVLIPGTTLILLVVAGTWIQDITAGLGVVFFGMGSVVGAMVCAVMFRRTSPRQILSTSPEFRRTEWLRACGQITAISFLMSWIFRVSTVILELLAIPEAEVGYFAAALETGCLVLLVSKSTDKLFQPDVSVIVQHGDKVSGTILRNRRYLFVGFSCALFMFTVVFFGREILGLYGREFRAGYGALYAISVGACVWTMFSLAPVYLRFVGRSVFVIATTLVGAVMMAALTAVLGQAYGATGAGIAFCIVLVSVAGVFFLVAHRDFSGLGTPTQTMLNEDLS